jgi:N-acetylmuramoyl-L-alanine amidase
MDDRRPASRVRDPQQARFWLGGAGDRVRPTRGWYCFIALALLCAFALPASAKLSVARKKEIARSAYDDAERMRQAFNNKSSASRTRAEYQRIIDAYRKVYYLAPNSTKAEPAIVSVAELLAEEGRAFNDERLLRNAIGQYQFLRKEYPGSARRVAALFAVGHIYADDLHDTNNARQTFQEFVHRYPKSELSDDARDALADLDAGKTTRKSVVAKNGDAKTAEPATKTPDAADDRRRPRKDADAETRTASRNNAADGNDKGASSKKPGARSEAEQAPFRTDLPPAVRAAAEKADAAVEGKPAKPESKKPVEISSVASREKKPVEAPSATSRDNQAIETLLATSRDKTDSARPDSRSDQPTAADAARKGKLPLVMGIRHWSTPDYTRIAVDLEQDVPYEVGRVSDPDRLFFDLHGTKLAPGLMGREYQVEDGLLKKVRVAQFQPGETRIVLDLGDVADYQAFLLPNPYRLIVDVHGKKKPAAAAATTPKNPTPAPIDRKQPDAGKAVAENKTMAPAATRSDSAARTSMPVRSGAGPAAVPVKGAADANKTTTDLTKTDSKPVVDPRQKTDTATSRAGKRSPDDSLDAATTAKSDANSDRDDDSPVKAANSARVPRTVMAREAKPTAAGDRSLIRALGLKIGRIVVDAGHGGHDTGTIGPSGLLEKDLVLDVALRLGKLLQSRMGADVVYTRDDDTFVPLETRTAIANREQADLFISVHANSSHDPKARGVETYYLNFTTSADALEVAARENAVSDTSIHELQDLVKKIALKEKVEESREFASDVQQSLRAGLSGRGTSMRDRGVKKAPFIVLIGANMPSILAEISFVSNPGDEKRLKTPDYRQKIAESLYRGVARYVGGLSGVKVAANTSKAGGQ